MNALDSANAEKQRINSKILHPLDADLSTAEGCEKLFAALPDIHILVNNLGIFQIRPFLEISDEEWLQTFQSNVLSGIRVT